MGPPPLNKSTGASGMFAKPPAGPSSSSSYANPLSKSAGASSMVGQPFMSAKIRLPEASSSTAGPALPPRILAPTVPKPFGSSMRPPQAQQPALPPRVVEPQEPLQELPDIDSEYSDSDDEAHERKRKALPGWAQSPAVAQALYDQQQVNPDEIFGPLPKLSIGGASSLPLSSSRPRSCSTLTLFLPCRVLPQQRERGSPARAYVVGAVGRHGRPLADGPRAVPARHGLQVGARAAVGRRSPWRRRRAASLGVSPLPSPSLFAFHAHLARDVVDAELVALPLHAPSLFITIPRCICLRS